ncbi:hypothetical protein KSP39_PZI018540 [Platanthera zijinensis]|uniref:Uncharacterized protein n=1 Tax=Platanthera zijinensis TaxID=2320716 RepID=A0AAP0B3T5_9ASPA
MIASLASKRVSHEEFVSDFYTISSCKNTCSGSFHGIPDITGWQSLDATRGIIELQPPTLIRRTGRPQTRRHHNTMDERTDRSNKKCGICKELGHNRSTCPTNPENRR